jgi:hypothetical protein
MQKPSFLFQLTVVLTIICFSVAFIAISFWVASCLGNSETPHYYLIKRLNIQGKVEQTYISKGRFPWVNDHSVDFYEYPSGHNIRINSNYTVEDLGININTL